MMVSACKIVALFGALRVASDCTIGVSGASGDIGYINKMSHKIQDYGVDVALVYGIAEGSINVEDEGYTFRLYHNAFNGDGDAKNVLFPSLFIASCDDSDDYECRVVQRLQIIRYVALLADATNKISRVSGDYNIDVHRTGGVFTKILDLNNQRSLAYRMSVCGIDIFNANFSPFYTFEDATDDYWKSEPDVMQVSKPFDYFKTLNCQKPGIMVFQDMEHFVKYKNTDEGNEFSAWLESCNIMALFVGVGTSPGYCHAKDDPLINKVPIYHFADPQRGVFVLKVKDQPSEVEVVLVNADIEDESWGLIGSSDEFQTECT